MLDPAFTDYMRRVLYSTYDVTDLLRSGKNALGVMLGNGLYCLQTPDLFHLEKAPWRTPPRMRLNLVGGVRRWQHLDHRVGRPVETIDRRDPLQLRPRRRDDRRPQEPRPVAGSGLRRQRLEAGDRSGLRRWAGFAQSRSRPFALPISSSRSEDHRAQAGSITSPTSDGTCRVGCDGRPRARRAKPSPWTSMSSCVTTAPWTLEPRPPTPMAATSTRSASCPAQRTRCLSRTLPIMRFATSSSGGWTKAPNRRTWWPFACTRSFRGRVRLSVRMPQLNLLHNAARRTLGGLHLGRAYRRACAGEGDLAGRRRLLKSTLTSTSSIAACSTGNRSTT